MDILSLFACFETLVTRTVCRQLAVIAQAVLTLPGHVTMSGIARWSEKGGSYRTVQRFFAASVPWTRLRVKFFETHFFHPGREYIVAGDETVVSKSGRGTFGVNRFFSSLRGKVIRGLSFFVLSVIDTVERKSSPLMVAQRIKLPEESETKSGSAKKNRKKRSGRPRGSRNRNKAEFKPSSELRQLNEMLKELLSWLRRFVKVRYLALDGHFGHNQAVLLARENQLELISKLRQDAVLFEKYAGMQSGRGAKKKYGKRLRFDVMALKYLQKSGRAGAEIINYYAGVFLHKEFAEAIKVVVIVKIDVQKRKLGHAVLFSSDLQLDWEKLIDYYSLRFQIEFNFRDAKQHFGLEDFMNTTQAGVENAANLAFMMVLLSAKLLKNSEEKLTGINDLKTHYRGAKYAVLVLKKVLKNPEPILIKEIIQEVGSLGSIHQVKSITSSA